MPGRSNTLVLAQPDHRLSRSLAVGISSIWLLEMGSDSLSPSKKAKLLSPLSVVGDTGSASWFLLAMRLCIRWWCTVRLRRLDGGKCRRRLFFAPTMDDSISLWIFRGENKAGGDRKSAPWPSGLVASALGCRAIFSARQQVIRTLL